MGNFSAHINSICKGCKPLGLMALAYLLGCQTLNAQTASTEKFGQNRVQYKDFTFQYYQSDNFTTYFYPGEQDVAKYVIKAAEDDADEIAKMLDYRYKNKIDIIVYNTINELNQTNIGIYDPGQAPGGTVKIPDSKIFIYFNGDHNDLRRQIREGIASLFIDKMVRGTGFAEVIQNAVLLNLPDWYKVGLVKYIGEPWSTDDEDRLRDGILSGRYKKLNKLQPDEAVFVGHSIWHYIEEVHGKTALNNILYLTRINRSVDNGFLFVLGTNLSQTLEEWYKYYLNRFENEEKMSSLPPDASVVKTRVRKNLDYYNARLSPDGKYLAYASNDMGRYKVHLLNTETHKSKVLLKGGFRTNTQFTDESIPLIAWQPDGKRLAMINDRRSLIFMTLYDMEKGKKEVMPIRKFQKVISFNFVDNKQLVMSGMQAGQSDIYLYTIASTTTRKLTDDYYDDLCPAYIQLDSIRGIMFSSNREDDTITPKRYESQIMDKQFDLFFYDLDANQKVLYRVTSTPNANEIYPQNFDGHEFSFISNANGINNRYIGHFDKVFDHNQKTYRFVLKESDELDSVQVRENVSLDSVIDRSTIELKDSSFEKVYRFGGVTTSYTNYSRGIKEQTVIPSKGIALDVFKIKNKFQLRKYDITETGARGHAPDMDYTIQLQRNLSTSAVTAETKKEEKQQKPIPTVNDSIRANRGKRPFDFQSEFDYGIKLFDWDSASASRLAMADNGYVFRFSKVRPYFVRLSIDKVIGQFDNNLIITRYQPFTGYYYDQPLPVFGFKLGVTDLLEDHKIYGGVRIPFSNGLQNLEFFLTYENLKKRLDKKFTFYRGSRSGSEAIVDPSVSADLANTTFSYKTTYLEAQLTYPLDVLSSLRFNFNFRNDILKIKVVDSNSLKYPAKADNWLSTRAEYVFDNCLEAMTNIRYGTRFKAFIEVQKEFPTGFKSLSDNFSLPVPKFNNKVLGIVGFDLRHYLKIYKYFIWANRISGAASFGTAKMIYYMGGLENWFTLPNFQKFDQNTPIDYNNNYAFQTIATPMRGYKQNARNGDKYLLINSELRFPIFATLINSPIKSDFIRNMQLLGFFDVGTAWQGLSPFSNDNPLFNQTLVNSETSPSIIVNLHQYKTPVIMGFGPGIRTSLFGYFLKFDAAWSYDTGVISKKPVYYFSMGVDF